MTSAPLPFTAPSHRARAAAGAAMLALGACSSAPGLADQALDLVGLQSRRSAAEQAASAAAARQPPRIALRIDAGEVLNTDASGRSLSLVAKVYALKDVDAFLQAPYGSFASGAAVAGAAELRDIVLTPGRSVEFVETLPADARYLAVVGLFRAPDDKRWRFAFDARTSRVTLGAHGCALSVAEGEPLGAETASLRLAGVRCR